MAQPKEESLLLRSFPFFILPRAYESVSQHRKSRMCRRRVISNAVRDLRAVTFVRGDNLTFRHCDTAFTRRREVGVLTEKLNGSVVLTEVVSPRLAA
jgi:hypothetical protein